MLFWHAIKSWHKLAYSTARKQKLKSGKRKNEKVKNGYAQKYRQTVRKIRGVSLEEAEEGYDRKD